MDSMRLLCCDNYCYGAPPMTQLQVEGQSTMVSTTDKTQQSGNILRESEIFSIAYSMWKFAKIETNKKLKVIDLKSNKWL